jgi:hypothetical protein
MWPLPEKSGKESPNMNPEALSKKDALIAGALAIAVFVILAMNLTGPGVTWDEVAPNFPAAKNQAAWFSSLGSLEAPFSKDTIDPYWQTTSDHPSLPRTIAALSYLVFSGRVDEIAALRLPSAVLFSALVASIFLFLRLFLPRLPALAGAIACVMMPRVFGHAHLFSLDIPIMCWWFWAAVSGYLVLQKYAPPWLFGLAYAIAFTTKLHAVFLPAPLLLWAALQCGSNKDKWRRLAIAILWTLCLTPLLYIALQPWLWHDTTTRILERFFDYAIKSSNNPIRLFYLGTLYTGNTPWHYPIVMFLFTVPAFLLLLFGLGAANLLWKQPTQSCTLLAWMQKWQGIHLFLLFLFIMPPLLILLPLAQGYDGCRLFLPCFPFAACIIGFGYQAVLTINRGKIHTGLLHGLLYVLLIVPSAAAYLSIQPYYLAYYNELAGGVDGAREKGMETTYWCDGLNREMLEEINRIVEPGKTIRTLSMPFELMAYYKERGWLRNDINHEADPPYDYHLLQCRQGMFNREEWFFYAQRIPITMTRIGTTPIYALYGPLR